MNNEKLRAKALLGLPITAKEFAEKLKENLQKYVWHNNIPKCMFNQVIDDLLKEYEK